MSFATPSDLRSPTTLRSPSALSIHSGVMDVVSLFREALKSDLKEAARILEETPDLAAFQCDNFSILSEVAMFGTSDLLRWVLAKLPADYNFGLRVSVGGNKLSAILW